MKQIDQGATDVGLSGRTGLTGMIAAGSDVKRDPKAGASQQALDRLNELFGSADFLES